VWISEIFAFGIKIGKVFVCMNTISKSIDSFKTFNPSILQSKVASTPSFLGKINLNALKFDAATFSERAKVLVKQPAMVRDSVNPMVSPDMLKHLGDPFATFNPGVIKDENGGVHLLVRTVVGKNYPTPPFVSSFTYGFSKDGKTIDPGSMKVVVGPNKRFPMGFEDPRITKVEGEDKYNIICTGYDGKHPMMCRWTTTDLADQSKYQFEGPIGPKERLIPGGDDKDALLLTKKIIGEDGKEKYGILHRVGKNIQLILVDNLRQLKSQKLWKKWLKPDELEKNTILRAKPEIGEYKLGGGPPPIETKEGLLFIDHFSTKSIEQEIESGIRREYCANAFLTDRNDPTKVIARSPYPIMKPEMVYEKDGPVPGVVFPQGLVQNGDNLNVYYGCGDKNVGVAETNLPALLKYLRQFNADGKRLQKWPSAPWVK